MTPNPEQAPWYVLRPSDWLVYLLIEMAPLTDTALVLASAVHEPESGLKGEIFFLPDPSNYQALAESPGAAPVAGGSRSR